MKNTSYLAPDSRQVPMVFQEFQDHDIVCKIYQWLPDSNFVFRLLQDIAEIFRMHSTWEVLFLKKYGTGFFHGKTMEKRYLLTPAYPQGWECWNWISLVIDTCSKDLGTDHFGRCNQGTSEDCMVKTCTHTSQGKTKVREDISLLHSSCFFMWATVVATLFQPQREGHESVWRCWTFIRYARAAKYSDMTSHVFWFWVC